MARASAQAAEEYETLAQILEQVKQHAAQQHEQRNAGRTVDVAAAGAYFRDRLQVWSVKPAYMHGRSWPICMQASESCCVQSLVWAQEMEGLCGAMLSSLGQVSDLGKSLQ